MQRNLYRYSLSATDSTRMVIITPIEDDLFLSQGSIAVCLSADVRMQAGLLRKFDSEFGHKRDLLDRKPIKGDVFGFRHGERYIFYLIIKDHFWEKPEYEDVLCTLAYLRDLCQDVGITRLNIPKLGCGSDRLDWHRVRELIESVFMDEPVHFLVYSLPKPKGV